MVNNCVVEGVKMAQVKKTKVGRKAEEAPFGKRNWIVLGAGLASIILGFIALASGSITLAPILLVLGYCVLIPVGIMIKDKETKPEGG
jgi:uncharacterized membrane protein HdeD (DUF308 family)